MISYISENPLEMAENYAATAGVGLNAFGPMQFCSLSSFDLYDINDFQLSGNSALKQVHIAQAMRAKERTMDELNSILGRISYTLGELREENDSTDSCSPTEQEKQRLEEKESRRRRIRKKIKKRRKKQKQKHDSQIPRKGDIPSPDVENKDHKIEGYELEEEKEKDQTSDEDDWCSMSSSELDNYDSNFSDISTSSDDDNANNNQPKSKVELMVFRTFRNLM